MNHKYRKRPKEVEARLFSGVMTISEALSLALWCSGEFRHDERQPSKTYYWSIQLPFNAGVARPGTYIVKTSDGVYSMKQDTFEAEYEET